MSNKVKQARLHSSLHLGEIGVLGDNLPTSYKNYKIGKFEMVSRGLFLIVKTEVEKRQVTIRIPMTNVAGMVMEEDEPVTKSEKSNVKIKS